MWTAGLCPRSPVRWLYGGESSLRDLTCEGGNKWYIQGQLGKRRDLLCTDIFLCFFVVFFVVVPIDFFYFIFPINSWLPTLLCVYLTAVSERRVFCLSSPCSHWARCEGYLFSIAEKGYDHYILHVFRARFFFLSGCKSLQNVTLKQDSWNIGCKLESNILKLIWRTIPVIFACLSP